jgi:membrane-bound ClpP family serine protease
MTNSPADENDRRIHRSDVGSNRPSALSRLFWFSSILVWVVLVSRLFSELISEPKDVFVVNLAIFLVAGLGILATTHFAAAAVLLLVGGLALTASDVKAGWAYITLYVIVAMVIGVPALFIQLLSYLERRSDKRRSKTD